MRSISTRRATNWRWAARPAAFGLAKTVAKAGQCSTPDCRRCTPCALRKSPLSIARDRMFATNRWSLWVVFGLVAFGVGANGFAAGPQPLAVLTPEETLAAFERMAEQAP